MSAAEAGGTTRRGETCRKVDSYPQKVFPYEGRH